MKIALCIILEYFVLISGANFRNTNEGTGFLDAALKFASLMIKPSGEDVKEKNITKITKYIENSLLNHPVVAELQHMVTI